MYELSHLWSVQPVGPRDWELTQGKLGVVAPVLLQVGYTPAVIATQ